MPIVTITTRGKKPSAFKDALFDAVQEALLQAGVPKANKFHRFLELAPEDFRFDSQYPDARQPRNDNFVLIEILWSAGRSVLVKKKVLQTLVEQLEASGIDPENAMVAFQETGWESWACAGGRLTHA